MSLKEFVRSKSGGEYTFVKAHKRHRRRRRKVLAIVIILAVAIVCCWIMWREIIVIGIALSIVFLLIFGLVVFGKRKRIVGWFKRYLSGEL